MNTYHLALSLRSDTWHGGRIGPANRARNSHTAVLHARRCIDHLPTDIRAYCGEREITKVQLRLNRPDILAWAKLHYPQVTRVVID